MVISHSYVSLPEGNYRTASESRIRTRDLEGYEDIRCFTVLLYSSFRFYFFGTTCTPQNRVQNYGEIIKPRGKSVTTGFVVHPHVVRKEESPDFHIRRKILPIIQAYVYIKWLYYHHEIPIMGQHYPHSAPTKMGSSCVHGHARDSMTGWQIKNAPRSARIIT